MTHSNLLYKGHWIIKICRVQVLKNRLQFFSFALFQDIYISRQYYFVTSFPIAVHFVVTPKNIPKEENYYFYTQIVILVWNYDIDIYSNIDKPSNKVESPILEKGFNVDKILNLSTFRYVTLTFLALL